MTKLSHAQKRLIKDAMAFPKGSGYVLDFSDRTILEFFEDEFRIDFDQNKYKSNGTSKGNRLIASLEIEEAYTAAKVFRGLWDRREALRSMQPDAGIDTTFTTKDF